jgi:hypothetical protein
MIPSKVLCAVHFGSKEGKKRHGKDELKLNSMYRKTSNHQVDEHPDGLPFQWQKFHK